MRLTHVRVEGCGRFIEPVMVSGFEPGLNVLVAPNESGKSTLFKAIRACLFEKHTSKEKTLRELGSEGASKPLAIEVGFVQDGRAYIARKTFLSSVRSALLCEGREIAGGRHADEKLHEILGVRAAGRTMDEGAFGLLWVRQRDSFQQASVDGAAKDSVEGAIEREVGTLVGGERARDALKALEAELSTLFTPGGQVKKTGPLGLAEERARGLAQELANHRQLLEELESDLDLLERRRRERARLEDPTATAEMRARLDDARQDLKAAEDAAREMEPLGQAEKLAAINRDEAARTLDDLRSCAQSIDAATEAQEALAGEIRDAEGRKSALSAQIEAVRGRLAELEAGDARDAQSEAHLRRLTAVVNAAASLPDLERKLAHLQAAADDRRSITQALAPLRASARHVQALDKIDNEAALLRARLEATATRIVITPAADASRPIHLDGRKVAGQTTFAATAPAIIAIEGVGEILIEPPAERAGEERAKLAELDAKRARVLADAGVADPQAARDQADERARIEAEATALRARLLALGSSEDALAADIETLRERVNSVRRQIEAELGAGAPAPEIALIAQKQDALQQKRGETAVARAAMTAQKDGLTKSLMDAGAELTERRARSDGLARQLEKDLKRLPPVERASRLAAAGAAFDKMHEAYRVAAVALQQAQARAPAPERLDQLRERIARLERARENSANALQEVALSIATIGERIQLRGGDGLGEKVAQLMDEHEIASRDAWRLRARGDALILLKDTIIGCYEEQRDKLQTPLRKRLQPFLNDVFPSAEITLDEGFSVERIVRAGAAESFERLSAGAQEQIAILVRLAMGALLRERGEDVPIILDDALAFCDDERIEHMFDALNRAARMQQVIVLTCRSGSFRSLGGKALTIEPVAAR